MLSQDAKQKLMLFITKYLSYLINLIIVLVVLGVAAWWVYMLFQSAQITEYHSKTPLF